MHSLPRRAARFAWRHGREKFGFARDLTLGTHARTTPPGLARQMDMPGRGVLQPYEKALTGLAGMTLEHRFDLLGSGWVRVRRDGVSKRINLSNRSYCNGLRSMIDSSYEAIDWHCDYKSGFRWPSGQWHRHIRFGNTHGVDVKVPWELSRMQHLPRLAMAFAIDPKPAYVQEFRNQVLDFLAANPPRFGVNWYCAMDVAIRAVNLLAAFDLFRSAGAVFDDPFTQALARSILEHGRHIRKNLERHGGRTNNHYLANIAGLLFIAVYLSPSRESERWVRFATGELIREVRSQFFPEGSNFEGSTCYHRLSAEMVVYATALLMGLDEPPVFPRWYLERLEGMAEFTGSLTMPDGDVPQIGDNDSGRFLPLTPSYRCLSVAQARSAFCHLDQFHALGDDADFWNLSDLNHGHLVGTIAALFGRPEVRISPDSAVIRSLAKGRTLREPAPRAVCIQAGQAPPPVKGHQVVVCRLPLTQPLARYGYPDFGLYIFKSPQMFLSIRCGSDKPRGSHAHHDHLSIELQYEGRSLFRDPGTFAYTSNPALRSQYRSLGAHSVPYPVEERERGPVFLAPEQATSECLYFGEAGFTGRGVFLRKLQVERHILLTDRTIEIIDCFPRPLRLPCPGSLLYSPGYGKLASEWIRAGRVHAEHLEYAPLNSHLAL
jgi:Heparinase II/III N-terminus/Heparinase II/III-like protein